MAQIALLVSTEADLRRYITSNDFSLMRDISRLSLKHLRPIMIHLNNAGNTNNTDSGQIAAPQDNVKVYLRPTEPLTYRLNLCLDSLLDYGQQRSRLYSSICIECVHPALIEMKSDGRRRNSLGIMRRSSTDFLGSHHSRSIQSGVSGSNST